MCFTRLLTITFQGITVPREDWYWPKTENEEEEDCLEEEEKEDAEEIVELTVCIKYNPNTCNYIKSLASFIYYIVSSYKNPEDIKWILQVFAMIFPEKSVLICLSLF